MSTLQDLHYAGHLTRAALANYTELTSLGESHEHALARLGLTEMEHKNMVDAATRRAAR